MISPLVSIISPCYNGEEYIGRFLESVLNQSYPNIELIVVDDGSTDETKMIINKYIKKFDIKKYNFFYIKQEKNKGQAAACNRGLSLFSGDYLMWMDSDDILYKDAIQKKVDFLEKNKNLGFVLNWGDIVDISDLEKVIGILKRKKPKEKDNLFLDLLNEYNVVFCPGSIMVRTKCLKKAIPNLHIFESREGQNWQFMLPLAYSCKWGYLNESLFKYVVRNDSHSHAKRSYEDEIRRRNNIFILQKSTIEKIVGMSDEEKNRWIQFSYNKQLKEKIFLSLIYRKPNDYFNFKKLLPDNGITDFTYTSYYLYPIKNIYSRIKIKIKEMLKNENICCLL